LEWGVVLHSQSEGKSINGLIAICPYVGGVGFRAWKGLADLKL